MRGNDVRFDYSTVIIGDIHEIMQKAGEHSRKREMRTIIE